MSHRVVPTPVSVEAAVLVICETKHKRALHEAVWFVVFSVLLWAPGWTYEGMNQISRKSQESDTTLLKRAQ